MKDYKVKKTNISRINNAKVVYIIFKRPKMLQVRKCYEDLDGIFKVFYSDLIINITEEILAKEDSIEKLEIKHPEYFIN
jgi:hypothetical protein